MIPSEVIAIADLIVPEGWRDTPFQARTLKAAWRIYNAGYLVPEGATKAANADK